MPCSRHAIEGTCAHAEGTSSSTLDQALRDSSTNGMLANGTAHREHPFASASAQPQQQTLCLLFGGFTGGGVDGTMLAVDAGNLLGSIICPNPVFVKLPVIPAMLHSFINVDSVTV